MGGTKLVPLGIFDDPPPEDSITIKSVKVRRNRLTTAAKRAQGVLDGASDLIDGVVPG